MKRISCQVLLCKYNRSCNGLRARMKSTKSSTSNMIVPEVLTGYNYGVWMIFMKSYLLGQGLWGIENGIECQPEPSTSPDQLKSWREKNGKALHAILISCEEQVSSFVVGIVSAKGAWDQLALMFGGMSSRYGKGNMVDDPVHDRRYQDLCQAVFRGDWKITKSLLCQLPAHANDYLTAIVSPNLGTLLHVAVSAGHLQLVENLVELMTNSPDALTTRSSFPTPLHLAACCGFTKIAEVPVKKSSYSLQIQDPYGLIPVAKANLDTRTPHNSFTQ
ncbi:uncharacterized protein LOC122058708 [Macadamia integrifolia]|uniref:uncharacterized protein LOC122058708 n=1 Tax=Macadamia integrifolia TaxID=60698 RepID=UPI001C52EBC0|nr:uncharacterized protein LOC122058708 [Macadamia integrifolia]